MSTRMLSVAAILLAASASAQEQPGQPPAAQEAQPAPSQPATSPKPAEQPTLDDLLGIRPEPFSGGKTPRPKAEDPAKAALERKLSNEEVSEAFVQAVRLMDETAKRIEASRDTSITTQRMQEDVIRKLDALIAQAEKQQRQSRSSSSRRSNQDPQNQPDQQQQQQQQSQQQQASQSAGQNQQNPPGRRDGELGPGMAQGAAWGALPERMRDALLQGNADKFSSIWGPLTEAYYRKLAEEAGR